MSSSFFQMGACPTGGTFFLDASRRCENDVFNRVRIWEQVSDVQKIEKRSFGISIWVNKGQIYFLKKCAQRLHFCLDFKNKFLNYEKINKKHCYISTYFTTSTVGWLTYKLMSLKPGLGHLKVS